MSLVEFVRHNPLLICAHRGASGIAPENTLVAFQMAIDAGATMLELDVQVTNDNHLVVFHDDDLERTTDGKGRINLTSLDELRELDAGSWFHPSFGNETIPLLREVLDLVVGRAYLNIEIKPVDADPESAKHIQAIVSLVDEYGMTANTIYSSFDHNALKYVKSLDSRIHTVALNIPGDKRLPHEVVFACSADAFGCSLEELTDLVVTDCHSHLIPVGVYTVNTPAELDHALSLRVNGVVSNFPDVLMKHYQSLKRTS